MNKDKEIKLWLSSPHFYPTYGGAQNRYRSYIPGLLSRGLDVNIMTGTPHRDERGESDQEVDWYQAAPGEWMPPSNLDGAPLERVRLPDSKGSDRTRIYYESLLDVCRRPSDGPVVAQLLTNMRPAARPWLQQLKQAGIATVYSVSQYPSWPQKPIKRVFRQAGYQQVYNDFDALVTNSPALEEFLRSIGVTTRIEYIPNGVNLDRFYPAASEQQRHASAALRDQLNIPQQAKVIIVVGAVMPRKGSDLVLAAWSKILARHNNTHLLFVGPRSDPNAAKNRDFNQKIEHIIAGSGASDQVHFTGTVDNVYDYLRCADAFVLASSREGTPNSVLEAQATALPAIVTPFTGLSRSIGEAGKHYLLVDRDVDALAEAIDRVLANQDLRRSLCDAGFNYVRQNADQAVTLDRYTDMYGEMAEIATARSTGKQPERLSPARVKRQPQRTPLLILGAPPRGGNHLLRGLLDNHPQLVLPPDEDYCIRHLARRPWERLIGAVTSNQGAPDFYRRLQKDGHLERINSGQGKEVFGTEGSLDLDAYYNYIRQHHQRFNVDSLIDNHINGLTLAIGESSVVDPLHVIFCALQPSNKDLSAVGKILSRRYALRGIFLIRDPRAHLSSKLIRNPQLDIKKFCQRQNNYWKEISWFEQNCGPTLRLQFEDLVTDTENYMRRICELAEIDYIPSMLNYTQGGSPSVSNSSFDASEGIDTTVLLRYRSLLSKDMIAYVEQHCIPELFWSKTEQLA